MRRVAILTAALTLAVTVTGCAHTVSGAAVRNQGDQPGGLRPGDADQVLLGAGEVGDVVGATLALDADRSRPIAGSSAVPACSALDAVGMSAFVGDDWSQFHVLLFTDGDRHEQVVSEAVAVYPDAAVAASAFAHGTRDVKSCDGQRAVGAGGDAAWSFSVPLVDADVVRWRKQQIGIPLTWVCHGEARLRNNAVLQVMACRGDDSGRVAVTTLADRMSASVWELSDR
ncbi:MAG: sensor domain-containing protein [Actinomycetota bacterium]|nr:sensor domain-containing protein [Actinomycetota bacterium]